MESDPTYLTAEDAAAIIRALSRVEADAGSVIPPLAYSIKTASKATGLSGRYLIMAIRRGALRAKRSCFGFSGEPAGKWVILAAELQAFLASLPDD